MYGKMGPPPGTNGYTELWAEEERKKAGGGSGGGPGCELVILVLGIILLLGIAGEDFGEMIRCCLPFVIPVILALGLTIVIIIALVFFAGALDAIEDAVKQRKTHRREEET